LWRKKERERIYTEGTEGTEFTEMRRKKRIIAETEKRRRRGALDG